MKEVYNAMHDKLRPPEFTQVPTKARRRPLRPVVIVCVVGLFVLTMLSAMAIRNPALEVFENSGFINPEMLAHVTPINAYVIDQGFKVEVVAAIWSVNGGHLFFTVEDLEGDRLNNNIGIPHHVVTHWDPEWSTNAVFLIESVRVLLRWGGGDGAFFDEESGKMLGSVRIGERIAHHDTLSLMICTMRETPPPTLLDRIFIAGAEGAGFVNRGLRRIGFGSSDSLVNFADRLFMMSVFGRCNIVLEGGWIVPFAVTVDEANAIVLEDIQLGDLTAELSLDFYSLRYSVTGLVRTEKYELSLELVMQNGEVHTFVHEWEWYDHAHFSIDGWWTPVIDEWWYRNELLWDLWRFGSDVDVYAHAFFRTPFDITQVHEIRMNGEVVYRAED